MSRVESSQHQSLCTDLTLYETNTTALLKQYHQQQPLPEMFPVSAWLNFFL